MSLPLSSSGRLANSRFLDQGGVEELEQMETDHIV